MTDVLDNSGRSTGRWHCINAMVLERLFGLITFAISIILVMIYDRRKDGKWVLPIVGILYWESYLLGIHILHLSQVK